MPQSRVFISYARADGEPLATRLDRDLADQGFEPWRDRREIVAGESWAGEIEDAMDRSQVLLAVLTPAAFRSRVCRGEQLRALRKGLRIVPVLGTADADRPVYLELAHYLDFSRDAEYPERLAELVAHLNAEGGIDLDHLKQVDAERIEAQLAASEREPEPDAPGTAPADWATFAKRLNAEAQGWWDSLAGRGQAGGIYDAALHVDRKEARAQLDAWQATDRPGLLMIGAAGVGKTHLLAHWLDARRRAGDAVWVVAGDRIDAAQLPHRLAQALGQADAAGLEPALLRLQRLARQAEARLWIVIDGLNDARGLGDPARELLEAADALPLPRGPELRLLLSCTSSTWQRLNRDGDLALGWGRYHQPGGSDVLLLEGFTEAEGVEAFDRYAARFQLGLSLADLPADSRRRLREPVLLRLLAEALRGRAAAPAATQFETLVFQRYWERFVRVGNREPLADGLAAELLAQRRASLPVVALRDHPTLGALAAPGSAAYEALLDDGVLSEVGTRSIFEDTTELRFTHPQIAAYAVVRCLIQRAGRQPLDLQAALRELLAAVEQMPLAWEAALTLLGLKGTADLHATLAGDADAELRELSVQSLVRRHAEDRSGTQRLLMNLLDAGTADQQRSAIRAAYHIGPDASGLLEHCALNSRENLRIAVRDTLYFIWMTSPPGASRAGSGHTASYFAWRHAPDFTQRLMHDLAARVSLKRPWEARRILTFLLDLLVTIHVNHCDRPEVVEQTADIVQTIARGLHLNSLARLNLPAAAWGIASRVVVAVLGEPVRDWLMLVSDSGDGDFFDRPPAERADVAEAALWIDPTSDLHEALPLLQRLLSSPVPVLRSIGSFVVGVHALARPDDTEPVVLALFESLPPDGRAWLTASMTLVLTSTPPRWLNLIEELTELTVTEDRDPQGPPRLLPFFDALYVPLALAAAKAGQRVAMFEQMLADAPVAAGRRLALTRRLLDALGIVGFYQPQAVLRWLGPHLAALLHSPDLRAATHQCLATIRTLHGEAVDLTLADAGAAEAEQHEVAVLTDPSRVQPFMRLVGFFNNAVHQCVHYPRMRQGLSQFALFQLAACAHSREFAAAYATQAMKMALEADFDLRQWMRSDEATAPSTAAVASAA
jgi:hypothetical protein